MIHLAMSAAAFLFLAFLALVALGIVAVIFETVVTGPLRKREHRQWMKRNYPGRSRE